MSTIGLPLCTPDDVEKRTGVPIEDGTSEQQRTAQACLYVSSVLRARFPLIPAIEIPQPVNLVATEVTVRYLGADPATGGFSSETIGAYSYQRGRGMGSTALTDDEYLVMAPYGAGPVRSVPLSNGPAAICPGCGGVLVDDECFTHFHALSVPLGAVAR